MKQFKIWMTIILCILTLYLAWFNNQIVTLALPWPIGFRREASAVLVYASFFMAGFAIAAFYFGVSNFILRRQLKKIKRTVPKDTLI